MNDLDLYVMSIWIMVAVTFAFSIHNYFEVRAIRREQWEDRRYGRNHLLIWVRESPEPAAESNGETATD